MISAKPKRSAQCDLCNHIDEEDIILLVQGAGKILVDVDFSSEDGSFLPHAKEKPS